MFQGEGLVRVAFGELLRFALAMKMQEERLAAWRHELEQGRAAGREEALEVIFSAEPGADIEAELRRIKTHHELPPTMHFKNEAHFLLVAIKNIDRISRLVRTALVDDTVTVRCVQEAISTFEATAPEVTHLRDLHEHVDQLLRGRGKAFSKLPEPHLGSGIALLETDIVYLIGGKVWMLGELSNAAAVLVESIRSCIRDRDARRNQEIGR